VAYRFNRQYRGEAFELPAEVEAMPIFREWAANTLTAKTSPFWKSLNPKRTSAVWILAVASAFNLSLARLASIFLWSKSALWQGCTPTWFSAELKAI